MDGALGELKKVPLREVWALEPTHFSVWLAENLDKLGDAIGLELSEPEREVLAGSFSADIVVQDLSRDRKVIIENQLDRTDHDHLGKVITYASVLEAGVVIWISSEFREEHRSALDWLNTNTVESCEFFGIQMEAWRIDDSRAAPNFKVIASPNGWQKRAAGEIKRSVGESERTLFFLDFFSKLTEDLRLAGFKHVTRPTGREWLIVERWTPVHIAISFSRRRIGVELVMRSPQSQTIFRLLQAHQTEIEAKLPLHLVWRLKEAQERQSIRTESDLDVDRSDEPSLDYARAWSVRIAKQFRDIFKPYVDAAMRELNAT